MDLDAYIQSNLAEGRGNRDWSRDTWSDIYGGGPKSDTADKIRIAQLEREVASLRKELREFRDDASKVHLDLHLAMNGGRTKNIKTGKITEHRGLFSIIAEMQKRIGHGLRYMGVYQPNTDYTPGDCVTYSGSVWYCKSRTNAKPEEAHDAWGLMCKRGRDGRDGARAKGD